MTTALAFSAVVWLFSFTVALYYLARLQDWRIGALAGLVAVVALGSLAGLSQGSAADATGTTVPEIAAAAVSVLTLFVVFVFSTTLQRASRAATAEPSDANIAVTTEPRPSAADHEIPPATRHRPPPQADDARVQALLDALPDGIITINEDGIIETVNGGIQAISGYAPEELIGENVKILMPEPFASGHDGYLRAYKTTGIPKIIGVGPREVVGRHKDGSAIPLEIAVGEARIGGERIFVGALRDASERNRAAEALRLSEERYAAAFRVNPDCIVISRASDGTILDANDKCLEIMGYALEDLKGTSAEAYWEEPDKRQEFLRQLRETGSVEDFDFVFLDRGGGRHIGLLSACFMELGGTVAVLAITRDVTGQKQAEDSLRQSEEKYSKAFMMSPDSLIITRAADGVAVEVNDRLLEMSGYRREEVLGKSAVELGHWVRPQDRERLMRTLEESGACDELETEYRTKDGKFLTVLISSRYIDLEGERCILSIVRDITESRRAQRELAESREMFQTLLDAVPLGINIKNREGRYTFMNPFQAAVYGTVPAQVIGKTPGELVNAEYEAAVAKTDRDVLSTGKSVPYFEEVTANADGVAHNWMTTKVLLGEKESPDAQVLSISLDMTGRKATEEQLHQAQKMEAVGQLTGGIAHDFNNLLTALLGNLQLLSDRTDTDELAKRYMEICLRAVNRGSDLTQRLLAFSRRQALNPRATDINALVGGMTELLERTLGAPIEITTKFSPDLWAAMVDQGQLENAVINLAINARDAMPAGGRLSIETANAALDGEEKGSEVEAGSYVLISVRDSGFGMAPEVLDQVFEPFFTTKEIGRGSGLGLSMVYGFVKQSGGHIEIDSRIGQGTTVRLYLPRADPSAHRAAVESADKSRPFDGDEAILVVEDDPDVRAFDVVILERLGYTVRSATDGAAALALADAMPELDLLLTDVLLPGGMSGKTIADRVVKRSPRTKVLFVSGFSEPAFSGQHFADEGTELLPKPYTRNDLARKVREVLDADGRAPSAG